MTRRFGGILAAAALAALLTPTGASADPDELMPCKIIIIKAPPAGVGAGLTKFVCKGSFALPSPGAAPTAPAGCVWQRQHRPAGKLCLPSFHRAVHRSRHSRKGVQM
jgi:hypothetical protein